MKRFFSDHIRVMLTLCLVCCVLMIAYTVFNTAFDSYYTHKMYSQSDIENMTLSLININTAGEDELCTLEHIDKTLAKRIIAYRSQHGAFDKTEDIKNVEGIGDKTYSDIAPFITTE